MIKVRSSNPIRKPCRYLITGGAGFLGVNLVRYLLEKGAKVSVIDIVSFDYADAKDNVKIFVGDIRDTSILKKAMKNIDYVIHTAAALPLYSKKDIYTTDIIGTKNVLDIAYNLKVKRVVHISSTAVYGIPDHHPIFETDKLSGVGAYGKSKILAEGICLRYRKKGLCVSVLRPKSFIGPERLGVFAIYFDWINSGKSIPLVGSGNNLYQLLDVEDMCESIWLCTTQNKQLANDTFNIGSKDFSTMKDDFGHVLEYAGYGKKIIPTPAKTIIFILRMLETLNISPLYKWVYETACEDSFVSIQKATDNLGFVPRYSNKEALIRNYEWYLSNHLDYKNVVGVSHRVPWKQGILGVVKLFF